MLANVGVEAVVGLVPVAGDLFDFYWKANSRNREMLVRHIDGELQPDVPKRPAWIIPALLIGIASVAIYFVLKNMAVIQ